MEKPKKLVELGGEKGWLVQHTIKGNQYWYLHIYDPLTQKTNKTKYVGKELPESLQELNRIKQEPEVTQKVTQRDLEAALETIEHQKGVIETLGSQPSDIDKERLQALIQDVTERIEVCIRSKRSRERKSFQWVLEFLQTL